MDAEQLQGIVFPATPDGRRSTAALGRVVVADALRTVDADGAVSVEGETDWRTGYLRHFRRLVEAGLPSRDAALAVARGGLASMHERMRVLGPAGEEQELGPWAAAPPDRELVTVEIGGSAEPETELSLPYHGARLRGDALLRRLDAWVEQGVVEPSCAEAVRTVMANPGWLALPGHTVAVMGAGAEMGPLPSLLRWGARVAAVDLPRPQIWEQLVGRARSGAGTLLLPVHEHGADTSVGNRSEAARGAGVDLISEVPAVARWLTQIPGTLVVGNYVYADGATNVRVSVAMDALTTILQSLHDDVALGFLATPTDVFAVPADAVDHSARAWSGRSTAGRVLGRPLRALSAGRLLQPGYAAGCDPGINDSLVPQQGPNYALAKRLQRWRAAVARDAGATVSMNVAPPTRTRSVLRNRALAAAYAGAHRFGVEVFEPATSNVLMAALLVHDLHTRGGPGHDHPWQDEAYAAVHGGLWRTAYAPRSALGLAALLGYGATRT